MWFKSDAMSAVETAMKQRGWKYARIETDTILTGMAMNGGSLLITIHNVDPRKTLLFLMHPATGAVPVMQAAIGLRLPFVRVHRKAGHTDAQVAQVCEALLEHNYQSLLGNFERDPVDGEVRLRIAVPYRDASVTSEQVNWCVDIGIGSVVVVMPKIDAILGKGTAAPAPLEEV